VTDSSGTVVYAAAHEPYGGIQKTWVTTYDPALKFSGKQRDAESELDYFGARYYDRSLYRFLSVDPVIPAGKAVANPQRWNLYAYCLDNPVGYVDSTGADPQKFIIEIIRYQEGSGTCTGRLLANGAFVCWTLENSQYKIDPGTYGADLTTHRGEPVIWLRNARRYVYDPTTGLTTGYEAGIKPGLNPLNAHNCIYLSYAEPNNGMTILTWEAWSALYEAISKFQEDMARHASEAMYYIDRSSYGGPCDMFFDAMSGLEALSWMLDDWYRTQIEIEVVIRQDQ